MSAFRPFRLVVAAAAVVALLVGPIGSAAAHDELAGTSPAQDVTVDTAPGDVALDFSEPPQSLGTEVVVTGPDGTTVSEGPPGIAGATVTQSLADGLPAGRYTVDWRATSADGHPLTGSFAFEVARSATTAAPAGGPTAPPDDRTAAPASSASSFPWVWVAIALIAAGAVVLVVRQLRRPT